MASDREMNHSDLRFQTFFHRGESTIALPDKRSIVVSTPASDIRLGWQRSSEVDVFHPQEVRDSIQILKPLW